MLLEELFTACKDGNLQLMREILKGEKLSGIGQIVEHKLTLFEEAYYGKHLDIVKFLIEECNQDVNTEISDWKEYKQPILLLSYRRGNYELAKYLIQKGADVNRVDSDFLNLAFHVCKNNDMEFFNLIIDKNPDFFTQPAYNACQNGNLEMMGMIMLQFENYVSRREGAWHHEVSQLRDTIIATLLTIAAKQNLYCMSLLILKYVKEGQKFEQIEVSPFYAAVSCGNLAVANLFLEKLPRSIITVTYEGKNSIHGCAISGSIEGLEYAFDFGYDIDQKDYFGKTPLKYAFEKNHIKIVKILLEKGAKVDNDLLNIACAISNLDMVRLLVDHGANVNHVSKQTFVETPLLQCLMANKFNPEVFNFLLSKGADIDFKSEHFSVMSRVMYLFESDQQAIISTLKHSKNKKSYLHMACEKSLFKVVKHLIDSGANPKMLTGDKKTLIHSWVYKGDEKLLDYLLSKGIDIDAVDDNGLTALNFAVIHTHSPAFEILKNKGASITIADNYGNTCLHRFAEGYSDIYSEDDNFKKIVNDKNKSGETALMIACSKSKKNYVKYLLSIGADPNIPDNQGSYPIHKVVASGKIEILDELIKAKVDMNVADKDGNYPIHIAFNSGLRNISGTLIRNGADLSVKDRNGNKASDYRR